MGMSNGYGVSRGVVVGDKDKGLESGDEEKGRRAKVRLGFEGDGGRTVYVRM